MKINENGIVREMTQKEEKEFIKNTKLPPEEEIAFLKQQLEETDYKAIKFSEGWITEEEYAPIKAERQEIRNQINKLESKLK